MCLCERDREKSNSSTVASDQNVNQFLKKFPPCALIARLSAARSSADVARISRQDEESTSEGDDSYTDESDDGNEHHVLHEWMID